MTTIQIVFEVVRKNDILGLEYRTGTKMALGYENENDIIEKVGTKEKINEFIPSIKESFIKAGISFSDNDYIDVYISDVEEE